MPVVAPHQNMPQRPLRIGILTDHGSVMREDGHAWNVLDNWHDQDPDLRVYCSVETVNELVGGGLGEALVWDALPKRWRAWPRPDEEQWVPRLSDVGVLAMPNFPKDWQLAMKGLVKWRDWLQSYGAHPTLSMGGSAMNLLQATLKHPVWTMGGDPPPFTWTMGPRVEYPHWLDHDQTFLRAVHIDLPSAYPRVMAGLRFGNATWRQLDGAQLHRVPFDDRDHGFPLILQGSVSLPDGLDFGPVPERPANPIDTPRSSPERCELLDGAAVARYPRSGRLQGVWAWSELRVAVAHGAQLDVETGWQLDNDGTRPFWPWWLATQEGRKLPGFAGQLAKSTANACWGSFVPASGERRVVSRARNVKLPPMAQRPPSYDLAELITAGVRAQAAQMLLTLGRKVISFHTDGGWVAHGAPAPEGWAVKARAARLDIQDPQTWRYRPTTRADYTYRVSGAPRELAEQAFRAGWERGELD